ncbi:MAG: hypothetical protein U9Q03_01705 [Patescibacteria group bacterium]|nr:hypothetical protein [Patescibacteria group bacterium]
MLRFETQSMDLSSKGVRIALIITLVIVGTVTDRAVGIGYAATIPGAVVYSPTNQLMGDEDVVLDGPDTITTFNTAQGELLDACEARGYGEDCAKILLGMMWKESLNTATAVGDGGRARGYFQIHYRLHNIPVACAEDLRCSAEWSLDYLEYNGYPYYVSYAVQCHNSCHAGNGYAASAIRWGYRLWDKPMFPDEGKLARAR